MPTRLITYDNASGGMHGMLKSVLVALHACARDGFEPVVAVEGSPYREAGFEDNLWDRFFEPIGEPAHLYDDHQRIAYHPGLKHAPYMDMVRTALHETAQRVIPCARIRERIAYWSALIPAGGFGVHYRGTDGHQVYPFHAPEKYAARLRSLRAEPPWLLCTDCDAAIAVLGREPGMIAADVERAADLRAPLGVHLSSADRQKVGDDAILDAWLLARCGVMVCGVSNLSDTVTILNPKIRMERIT